MSEPRKKITLPYLFDKVKKGEPITWLTCYDYPTAYLQEQAGIEMILVGDSLGMTMLGFDSTLPVKMDDMIRHAQAVRRGAPTAFVIGDMPYMTYQQSVEAAILNAGRFMAECGCDAIKLEGGAAMADRIKGIVDAGIPAIGHLGLTPQSVSALGGFRLQGKVRIVGKEDRGRRQSATRRGAFAILLELVPDRLCQLITERAEGCIIMSLGSGPERARSTADLSRYVRPIPQVQTENGEGLWQRGRGHPQRFEELPQRSHRRTIPHAGKLFRHA